MTSKYPPFEAPLLFKGRYLLRFFNRLWEKRSSTPPFTLTFPPARMGFKVKPYMKIVPIWGFITFQVGMAVAIFKGDRERVFPLSLAYSDHPFFLRRCGWKLKYYHDDITKPTLKCRSWSVAAASYNNVDGTEIFSTKKYVYNICLCTGNGV